MRIAVVGTSHWTQRVHGAAAAAHPDWELVSVWGRSADKAAAVGELLGCGATTDFTALLEQVDALVFAVPPDVQAPLAIQAALAGKHLLLEKPLALDVAQAEELCAAIDKTGVASAVFFTRLWTASMMTWLDGLRERGGWESGRCGFVAALPEEFLDASPWRKEHGALWDVGPHVLSVLERVLGPVEAVTALAGTRDLRHLAFRHQGGSTSSAEVTLTAAPDAGHHDIGFWGEHGRSGEPETRGPAEVPEACAAALTSLAHQARTGERPGTADAAYGLHVVKVLAAAQASLSSGRTEQV
jgi:predicted dehydrogenase